MEDAADTITALRAEVERLRQGMNAKLSDHINGTPCAEIRWQQERDTLTARVKVLEEALKDARDCVEVIILPLPEKEG